MTVCSCLPYIDTTNARLPLPLQQPVPHQHHGTEGPLGQHLLSSIANAIVDLLDVLQLLLKVDVQVFELSRLDVEDPAVNDWEALLLIVSETTRFRSRAFLTSSRCG